MADEPPKSDEIVAKSRKPGGRRPGAGRKSKGFKALQNSLIEAANARIADWMDELLDGLKAQADRGDRDSAIYLLNRLLGKPKDTVEQEHSGVLRVEVVYEDRPPLAPQAASGPEEDT
jgi:hypothetical protein